VGAQVERQDEKTKPKVAGGFVLPRCWLLLAAFQCYRQGRMPLRAVRVWLALWEIQARRCRTSPKRRPRFRCKELLRLIGGGGEARTVKSDVRRLLALGLVSLQDGQIRFPDTLEQLEAGIREQLREQLAKLPNHARRVPLPRRVVRFLAGAGTRALLATALGEAMRLLYYKNGEVSGRGRSKASWLAATFDVDLRNVKRARAHLEDLGLITAPPAESGYGRVQERRWGRVSHWNLTWNEAHEAVQAKAQPCTGLPPVEAKIDTGLPPVESNNTLSEENKNQEPALCGPAAGFPREESSGEAATPTICNIVEADLTSDARTQGLFEDAAARGLIEKSEAGQLRFFGLAEHARRYGTTNRPGLLRALLTKKRWWITQDDEDLARMRIKRLEMGQEAPKERRDEGKAAETMGSVLARILAQARPVSAFVRAPSLPQLQESC
jgi:hypothetical protein